MQNVSVSASAPAAPLFPVPAQHERFLRLPEVMHLCGLSRSTIYDLISRDAFPQQVSLGGKNVAWVVRIYQLKDRKTFDSTDYPSLFATDSQAIKADLVEEKDIRLQPGGAVTVDMPMDESAQYVAIAGMFISPDLAKDTWRAVLSREDLDPDKARVIEAGNNQLTLVAVKDK